MAGWHLAAAGAGACALGLAAWASLQQPDGQQQSADALPQVDPDTPFRWSWRTGGGAVLAAICASLANSAGIGGGPFYMPLFNSILGFSLKASTALSHTTVSVSAVASSLYGFYQTSPNDKTRPLADLDLVVTFLPALLLGVSVGVLGNVLLPDWLQTTLLTLLLLVVVWKTAGKARKQAAIEAQARADTEEKSVHRGVLNEESHIQNVHYKPPGAQESLLERAEAVAEESASAAASGLRGAFRRMPWKQLAAVLFLWAVFLVSQQRKSRFGHCTLGYLGWVVFQVAFLSAFTALAMRYEAARVRTDPEHADPELRSILSHAGGSTGGKRSTVAELSIVVVVMAASGACAGLLGIGGALVFNPCLLQLGVHPQVVASTAVLMILFSSSSIAISLSFEHLLNTSYALVYAPVAFAGSLVGVVVLGRLVQATGRPSITIWILTALILVGTLLTAGLGSARAWEDVEHGGRAAFKSFCAA